MTQPTAPALPPRKVREKYPRMIIVCMVISAVLSIIIAGTLVVDFVLRSEKATPDSNPQAFDSMLERPREAYTPPN